MTTVLGRFELQRQLGAGGMAEVWLARTQGPSGFSKQVVVKRILPGLLADPTIVELFKSEARIAARLDHPNLLQVFEFGQQPDGAFVMVMELVDGASLRAVLRAAQSAGLQLDVRLVARLIAQACEGLAVAHALVDEAGAPMGVVHRDISPDNILLARTGGVKLADFGIARISRGAEVTAAGSFRGKLGYAAPEQVLGDRVNQQSDLWAVGVTLFELLTFERPFGVDGDVALVQATVAGTPRRVDAVRPDCPAALADIVARCLERDPARRWESAHALSVALEHFISDTGAPLLTSHLGALLSTLKLEPARSPTGTPAVVSLAAFESEGFEPIAELGLDGRLYPMSDRPLAKAPRDDAAPGPSAAQPEWNLAASTDPNRLAVTSLAERFESLGSEAPAPSTATGAAEARGQDPAPPSRRSVIKPLATLVAVAGVIALGVVAFKASSARARVGAVILQSEPSGAQVMVNGQVMGETPWATDNRAGLSIVLKRKGYVDGALKLEPGADYSGTITLKRR